MTLREDIIKLSGEQPLNEDFQSVIGTALQWLCGGTLLFTGAAAANMIWDWFKDRKSWNEHYAPKNQKIVDNLATQIPESNNGLVFAAGLDHKSSEAQFVISVASKLVNKYTKDGKLDFSLFSAEYQKLLSERLAKTQNKMETDSDIKEIASNVKTINANLGIYFKISGLQARQLKAITLKVLKAYFENCKINLKMVYRYADWGHAVDPS